MTESTNSIIDQTEEMTSELEYRLFENTCLGEKTNKQTKRIKKNEESLWEVGNGMKEELTKLLGYKRDFENINELASLLKKIMVENSLN